MDILKKHSIRACVIILMPLLVYIPAIKGGFVWDDNHYGPTNPIFKSSEGLIKIFFDPQSTYQYYPLVHASFWVQQQLWGDWSMGYHIVNVLIHGLCAVLLWRVFRRLDIPGSWVGAVIFALHPVHAESVAWITEHKNVLSGFFYIGSALCLLRFFFPCSENKDSARQWCLYVSGLLLFICALLSKTVTCSLPAAMVLVLWWKRGRVRWQEFSGLVPFFLMGIGMGSVTAWLERYRAGAQGADWDLSFVERFLIAGRALWFYAGKLAWPADLMFVYPRWKIDAGAWEQYAYPIGVLLLVFLLWAFRSRVGRAPLAAVLFFSGTLFPALGFFNVFFFLFSYVADHFQYLASIGLIALATGMLTKAGLRMSVRAQRIMSALGMLVLLLYGMQTWRLGYNYKDSETLWTQALKKNPDAWLAHNNLGLIHFRKGKTDEATDHYLKALQVKPDYELMHYNLGVALASQGKLDKAVTRYSEALRIRPDYPEAHLGLGTVLMSQGKIQEAVACFSEALRIRPDFAQAYYSLGLALSKQGKIQEAAAFFLKATDISPNFAEAHYALGGALSVQGKIREAVVSFSEAIRIRPDFAEAYNNMGIALNKQGKIKEAVVSFLKALEINPNFAEARYNLDITLAALGKNKN